MTAAGLGSSLVVDALIHAGANVTASDLVRKPLRPRGVVDAPPSACPPACATPHPPCASPLHPSTILVMLSWCGRVFYLKKWACVVLYPKQCDWTNTERRDVPSPCRGCTWSSFHCALAAEVRG